MADAMSVPSGGIFWPCSMGSYCHELQPGRASSYWAPNPLDYRDLSKISRTAVINASVSSSVPMLIRR